MESITERLKNPQTLRQEGADAERKRIAKHFIQKISDITRKMGLIKNEGLKFTGEDSKPMTEERMEELRSERSFLLSNLEIHMDEDVLPGDKVPFDGEYKNSSTYSIESGSDLSGRVAEVLDVPIFDRDNTPLRLGVIRVLAK